MQRGQPCQERRQQARIPIQHQKRIQDGTNYTLTTTGRHAVSDGLQVRRLTPAECERLQGFPDNHTQIPWRGKPAADCPDSPRYKAIGNSMAVPVMRWIGRKIKQEKERCNDP